MGITAKGLTSSEAYPRTQSNKSNKISAHTLCNLVSMEENLQQVALPAVGGEATAGDTWQKTLSKVSSGKTISVTCLIKWHPKLVLKKIVVYFSSCKS